MMLQGHTVDAVLLAELRDSSSMLYNVWLYFRGITAPLFFSVSGFLMGFLLSDRYGEKYKALLKKNLYRGCLLIIIGYVLRINISALYNFGDLSNPGFRYFLSTHVLHIIGVAVLLIALVHLLFSNRKHNKLLTLFFVAAGGIAFYIELEAQAGLFDSLPLYLSNYFSKDGGSVFIVFPWIGYSFFGVALGRFYQNLKTDVSINLEYYGLSLSLILINLATIANLFAEITSVDIGNYATHYLWRYSWLGYSLLILCLFLLIEKKKNINQYLQKIGSKTLAIFVIHELVLFGSVSGYGLAKLYKQSLSWSESLLLALLVIFLSLFFAFLPSAIKKINNKSS